MSCGIANTMLERSNAGIVSGLLNRRYLLLIELLDSLAFMLYIQREKFSKTITL